MSLHVMIDLETLSTHNFACILSIGSCKFDPDGLIIIDKFHVGVDPESCQRIGLRIDAPTVMWWLDPQHDAARVALKALARVTIHEALDGFAQWFGQTSLPTWGSGATFDNVIMRNAFTLAGIECPWKFWDDRCFRTLKNLAPGIAPPRQGLEHSAVDDAVYQAETMQVIVKHLGLKL